MLLVSFESNKLLMKNCKLTSWGIFSWRSLFSENCSCGAVQTVILKNAPVCSKVFFFNYDDNSLVIKAEFDRNCSQFPTNELHIFPMWNFCNKFYTASKLHISHSYLSTVFRYRKDNFKIGKQCYLWRMGTLLSKWWIN